MFEKGSGAPRAEIVVVGNEVTSGLIEERNARYLGLRLDSAGFDVLRVTSVGDAKEEIADAVRQAMDRVDWIILTGGLGGTHDDLTKPVLANLFSSGLRRDEEVYAHLERWTLARGRAMTGVIRSQSDVPEKAEILFNDRGTAPGLLFREGNKRVYALPGVPLEMEYLFEKYIFPELSRPGGVRIVHLLLNTTGVSESDLWTRFGSVSPLEEWCRVASLPSHLGVRIRLSAVGSTESDARGKLNRAREMLEAVIGTWVYGYDQETLEEVVGGMLRKKRRKVAVAESCTGGLVAHRLTQVSGSSEYFDEGMITYSNQAKEERLGVPRDLLMQHGAVSREVAMAMAEGIRKAAGADYGVSTTGIAGPTGGSPEKPVGLTFIAVADANGTECARHVFYHDRIFNKERAAQAALNLLRMRLFGSE